MYRSNARGQRTSTLRSNHHPAVGNTEVLFFHDPQFHGIPDTKYPSSPLAFGLSVRTLGCARIRDTRIPSSFSACTCARETPPSILLPKLTTAKGQGACRKPLTICCCQASGCRPAPTCPGGPEAKNTRTKRETPACCCWPRVVGRVALRLPKLTNITVQRFGAIVRIDWMRNEVQHTA